MKRLENKKKLRETIANNGGRVGSHNHNWKGDKAKIHKSGFTLGDYKKMAKEQNEVCAICGGKETRKKSDGKVCRLMIDHDHKTNKVRGLLCHNCNVGLGHFLDNVEFLLKAIKYIKER